MQASSGTPSGSEAHVRPSEQRELVVVPIAPPPENQRRQRSAAPAESGTKRNRYTLPSELVSSSPVGFRTRVSFTNDETKAILPLLSMTRPTGFLPVMPVSEGELFEESALGVLTARQSTNFRGHRQVTLGPKESTELHELLGELSGCEAEPLPSASYSHVVLVRPYRTPFTFLLTFVGHKFFKSLWTVAARALKKRILHTDDIPTIGYLKHLHVGVLADGLERAVVVASEGKRRAQVFMAPFAGGSMQRNNGKAIERIERLVGLNATEKAKGWRIALVAQVGVAKAQEALALPRALWRKLGANLLAFRSERIQPGVNQEAQAPAAYQTRQDMDVPTELTVMAGRAAYNAFTHWTALPRELAKDLLLLERVDVLTPNGKERLRQIRHELGEITNRAVRALPLWADLPLLRALTKNMARGRKAFALAGQRIYIAGLSKTEIARAGISWEVALRAVGAAAARSALYAELMGATDIPEQCDLLAGVCLMAGPVNQNDIGKQFFGYKDLLAHAMPDRDPTSLLLWTLKAKTVADPIGNEEQLLNASRQGALVDLRPGPHDIIRIKRDGRLVPMRAEGKTVSDERAFSDVGNFVRGAGGEEIRNNAGTPWPDTLRTRAVWE